MRVRRSLRSSFFTALAALAVALLSSTTAHAAPRPRLGVIVVFDQMPAVLLERYAPFFADGGFGGLDGATMEAWFNYAGTETGPGHATLLTGTLPSVHGIATNTWMNGGKKQYVVDDNAQPVFAPTATDALARAAYGRSGWALRVPTLGDAMKVDSAGRARVVTVSLKDRAAILTAGQAADLALWYDPAQARFTTSVAYKDALPAWLVELGAQLPKTAMAEGTWSPLPVPPELASLVPVDDREGEGAMKGLGRTFPHDLKSVEPALQAAAYRISPQAIDDVFTLALRAVDEEQLGRDDEPDLLVVSVSTTDVVGHNYGSDSLEALDIFRRADRSLRTFLRALDARVGRGHTVVGVTSDHGGTPLPQTARAAGLAAPVVFYGDVIAAAEKAAAAVLASSSSPPAKVRAKGKDAAGEGQAPAATSKARVLGYYPPQLFVDTDDLDAATAERVLAAVARAVEGVPGIARVYDLAHPGDDDGFLALMQASAPPGRAARLSVRQHARVVQLDEKGVAIGTDHGSPYAYDRRVPFLLAGPGVKRGRFVARVDARDVSATFAALLRVSPPDAGQGHPVEAVADR